MYFLKHLLNKLCNNPGFVAQTGLLADLQQQWEDAMGAAGGGARAGSFLTDTPMSGKEEEE